MCGEEEETTHNHLLQCDGCREFVHMDCYGVPAPPEGRLWLCDVCKLGGCPNCQALERKAVEQLALWAAPSKLCIVILIVASGVKKDIVKVGR